MKRIFLFILLIFYLACNNLEVNNKEISEFKIKWNDIHIERVIIDGESLVSNRVYLIDKGEYIVEILYYYDKNTFKFTNENMVNNIVYRKIIVANSYQEYVINRKYEIIRVEKDNPQRKYK